MALQREHYIGAAIGLILGLGVLSIIGYNYWGWFGGSKEIAVANGSPCVTTDGTPGVYDNGTCISSGGPRPVGDTSA